MNDHEEEEPNEDSFPSGWFICPCMYGVFERWFDKSWRPGEIELVE